MLLYNAYFVDLELFLEASFTSVKREKERKKCPAFLSRKRSMKSLSVCYRLAYNQSIRTGLPYSQFKPRITFVLLIIVLNTGHFTAPLFFFFVFSSLSSLNIYWSPIQPGSLYIMSKNNTNNKEKSSFWKKLGLGKSKSSVTSLKSETQQQQQQQQQQQGRYI
jgi:hypothetical protein